MQPEDKHSLAYLKMARTSNARFDRSANAILVGYSQPGPVSVGLVIFPRSYILC